MVIPINKQGGRATYYYPGDGYLRRYDDFGVTQISLEAWTRRQDAQKAFWGARRLLLADHVAAVP